MADDEGDALGIVMGGDAGERGHGGVVGMFRGDEEILEKVGGVRTGKVGRDVLAWKRQNRILLISGSHVTPRFPKSHFAS